MADLNPTPPTDSENNSEDEYMECTMHDLVGNDNFYEEVETRLENPNERDESGYTLLHAAVWSREENSRILQLLLDKNAVVDSTTLYKHTPLHFAVANRKRNAVAALIEAGASVNRKDAFGRTALHFAIGTTWSFPPIPILNLPCDMWIVERLLSHPDIDPNPVDNAGSTPLLWAVRTKKSDVVGALLQKGADPNIPNGNNRTPLHVALSSQNPDNSIVCALLSKGVGIYCEDKFGQTPMDLFILNVRYNYIAQHVVWSIVLRYKVSESLVRELKQIPRLYKYFKICRREVRRMKRQVNDPLLDIYVPVVRMLLSGSYREYLDLILKRMTKGDLHNILHIVAEDPGIERLFAEATHYGILRAIEVFNV